MYVCAMSKTHVYFMPGMAASSRIFEHIRLDDNLYELHFLEWLVPESIEEDIEHYCGRMAKFIEHSQPILIGVSFGGVIVQELKKFVHPQRIIIISSVKSNTEFPKRLQFAQKTNAHKWLPFQVFSELTKYEKYIFTDALKKRFKLYKMYLRMTDSVYLPWAVHTLVNWNRSVADPDVIHIHGADDFVFPVKYIKNYISIERGTHIMIVVKAKKISEMLNKLLRE